MEFRILGPTEVLDGGRRLPLPSGRGRALLALLALHAGESISADRLIDELWGEDPPPTARTVVQNLVSRLRRVLEPQRQGACPTDRPTRDRRRRLPARNRGACGRRSSVQATDRRGTRRHRRQARATMLSAALALWRGPALADFTYEPFAQRAITALEELRTQAIEDRIEADLASGRATELVPELEQLIRDHPFRERLRGSLMLALYRSGRQAAALQAYQDARSLLRRGAGPRTRPRPA